MKAQVTFIEFFTLLENHNKSDFRTLPNLFFFQCHAPRNRSVLTMEIRKRTHILI